jgi:uncharacterized membrane protein
MILLVLSLLAFGIVHLIPAIPRAKAWARGRFGKAYGPVYGMASLLLLALTLAAFRFAPAVDVYQPASWGTHANMGLTLIGFVFLGIFLFRGAWRNQIRYPMLIAVGFWALGHLLANGDGRSVVFFGGFAAIATLQVFLASRLNDWVPGEERNGHNLLSVLFGIAAYGVVSQLHPVIAGVPVFDLSPFVH